MNQKFLLKYNKEIIFNQTFTIKYIITKKNVKQQFRIFNEKNRPINKKE